VNHHAPKPKKVVLAYSGGLDTSIIIPWLRETYGCEVIAMIGDVGQQEDLEAARQKALATGASSVYTEDLRVAFIRDYIWPTLRAGAVYEHGTTGHRQAPSGTGAVFGRGRPGPRLHWQGKRSSAL
jgi:argininosuccinate synthase